MRIAARAATTARNDTAFTKNTHAVPTVTMRMPASAGPVMRAEFITALFSATAFGTFSGPTISSTNAWRAGSSTTTTRPSAKATANSIHTCATPVMHDQPQHDREHRRQRLRDEQHAAAIEAVGDHAAPQSEEQDWPEAERERRAHRRAAARDLQDEPRLGHGLHPPADVGDQVAGEEEAVVVGVERAERPPHGVAEPRSRTARGSG